MTTVAASLRQEAIEEVARWIGKSGFLRHITDHDRAWQIALREAEGLLFDEYGAPTEAYHALAAYLRDMAS